MVKIVETNQDFLILVEICQEILTLMRLFETGHVKNFDILKYLDQEMYKIYLLLNQEKVSRFAIISLTDFSIKVIKSFLRYLDHRDQLLESFKIFSTVETYFLSVQRLRISIETLSRHDRDPQAQLLPYLKLPKLMILSDRSH